MIRAGHEVAEDADHDLDALVDMHHLLLDLDVGFSGIYGSAGRPEGETYGRDRASAACGFQLGVLEARADDRRLDAHPDDGPGSRENGYAL